MNKTSKIFLLIIVGFFLLGVAAVIKSQSGINLVWLVAVIILLLYNIIPTASK
jgi:hypothetical protein